MENILEVSDLSKNYKDFSLKNISFNLERGYIMGFIGPNGAGKSTTIRLIMNLIKKASGNIKVFGLDNIKNEKEVKQKIGFVYDENYFYEDLNLMEMKDIIAPFYKHWDENKSIFFSTHITSDLEKIADYITFINKGEIVFSEQKDDILENYSIVKGKKKLLNRDNRKKFVSINENAFGFEALTNNTEDTKKLFGNDVLLEKASLEDIMVYTVRSGENA